MFPVIREASVRITRSVHAALILALFLVGTVGLYAQAGTGDSVYQQLRHITAGTEAVTVSNVTLHRDIGTFTLKSGTVYFLAPVENKITGAVFIGDGTFVLEPSSSWEKRSVAFLTQEPSVKEDFSAIVFRFTDGTYEELKKDGISAQAADGARATKLVADNLETLTSNRVLRYNLTGRILQDVLSSEATSGVFYAFISGKHYGNKQIFTVDPQGLEIFGIQPEEVAYASFEEAIFAYGPSIWYAGHLANEDPSKARGTQMNGPIDIQKQQIDVTIEKNARLSGTATTTFAAAVAGLRVARFNLFRNFQIQSVIGADGQSLPYVMEERGWDRTLDDDPANLVVILPKALALGESFTIKTTYGGKEAVTNEGGGNYYPVARDDWYPTDRHGDYSEYELTFHIPKGMAIAATGLLVRDEVQGDQNITQWKSDGAISVAGFNLGRMKTAEAKLKDGFLIRSYANESQPNWVLGLQRAADLPIRAGLADMPEVALGTMSTVTLMKLPLTEGQIAVPLYTDFFGPTPFKQVLLTQQTACSYGQAWPGLVWLPICSFYDSTVRHQIGLDDTREAYWAVVTPHEIAHQWWGHTVGWASYRDQWMSEGFAEFSASLFTQYTNKNMNSYLKFWGDRQRNMQYNNEFGLRYSSIAPITMGFRLINRKSGSDAYRVVIYPKGAFVLHMLRMMMLAETHNDHAFKQMMHDFVQTYQNRPASTEDFKQIVEKHMTPGMDLDGNRRMDWFFNEWVYGTEIPKYTFSYDTKDDPEKGLIVSIKLAQAGVSDNFKMQVPIYAELADGNIIRFGTLPMKGSSTRDVQVPVGKVRKPKRMMVNYLYDILSAE